MHRPHSTSFHRPLRSSNTLDLLAPHSKTAMVQSRSFYSIIFMQMTNAVECRQSSQKPACFKVRSLYSGVAKGDLGVKPPPIGLGRKTFFMLKCCIFHLSQK